MDIHPGPRQQTGCEYTSRPFIQTGRTVLKSDSAACFHHCVSIPCSIPCQHPPSVDQKAGACGKRSIIGRKKYKHVHHFLRLRVTPVSPVFVLGAELAMHAVRCAVSLATLLAAALLWGVRLRGSLPAFLGSWALTMLSTMSIGMLAGGVAKNTKQASVVAAILYFPMLAFSGTTLPIEVMPAAMQKIVNFFPLTQGLTMMKHTFLGICTGSVLLPISVMVGAAALRTTLAVHFFRWE